MTTRILRPLIASLIVLASLLAGPTAALAGNGAGTYVIPYPAAGNEGWSIGATANMYMCVLPNACGGSGAAVGPGWGAWAFDSANAPYAKGNFGSVAWAPPANTSLDSARLVYGMNVANDPLFSVSVRDKSGQNPLTDTAGKLHNNDLTGAPSPTFAGGIDSGISMRLTADAASTYTQRSAKNGFTIQSADMTVFDGSDPVVQSLSAPAWGDAAPWITDGSVQCVTAPSTDAGGGIVSADLYDVDTLAVHQDYHRGNAYVPGYTSGTFQTCVNTGAMSEGDHHMYFDVTDAGGNYQEVDLGSISIDRTPPTIIQVGGPGNGATTNYTSGVAADLDFDYTVGVSGFSGGTFTLDGVQTAVAAGGVFTAPDKQLAEGGHNWSLTITSAAGLSSSTSGSFTVSVPAPTASVLFGPAASSTVAQPDFGFRIVDGIYGLASVNLAIDGKDAGNAGGEDDDYTFTAPKLAPGKHSWTMTAVSLSGKSVALSGSFATAAVPVGAPTAVVVSVPGGVVHSSDGSFTFRINDDPKYDLKSVAFSFDNVGMGEAGGEGDLYVWDLAEIDPGAHHWKLTVVSTSGKTTVVDGSYIVSNDTVCKAVSGGSCKNTSGSGSTTGTQVVSGPGAKPGSAAKINRRIVAPARVNAKLGKLVLIRVHVLAGAKTGAKGVKGAKVTCAIGRKVVARATADAKGFATCRFKATASHTVRVGTLHAASRSVKLIVKR